MRDDMENMLDEYINVPVRRVKKVHLENRCGDFHRCNDGYGYIVLVNDKTYPEQDPPKYEKSFSIIADTDRPLSIIMEFSDGSREVLEPAEFDLQLADLRITIHPRYCPCRILIGDYDAAARCLRINFREGERPWVYLKFRPTSGGKRRDMEDA